MTSAEPFFQKLTEVPRLEEVDIDKGRETDTEIDKEMTLKLTQRLTEIDKETDTEIDRKKKT